MKLPRKLSKLVQKFLIKKFPSYDSFQMNHFKWGGKRVSENDIPKWFFQRNVNHQKKQRKNQIHRSRLDKLFYIKVAIRALADKLLKHSFGFNLHFHSHADELRCDATMQSHMCDNWLDLHPAWRCECVAAYHRMIYVRQINKQFVKLLIIALSCLRAASLRFKLKF